MGLLFNFSLRYAIPKVIHKNQDGMELKKKQSSHQEYADDVHLLHASINYQQHTLEAGIFIYYMKI
jgi:hypothetical protein